jgi:hypothetical protein
MEKLKSFFDAESCRVYFAGATGTAAGLSVHQAISIAVGAVTFLYIMVKLIKQLRDWRRPDE